MMFSSKNKDIPQVQGEKEGKGFLQTTKDALGGATKVSQMVTELRPIIEQTAQNLNVATAKLTELSVGAQETFDKVNPLVDQIGTSINDLKPEIHQTAQALRETASTFQDLGEDVTGIFKQTSELVGNANDVLEKLKQAFQPVEITIMGKNIVPILYKIAKIIANLAMAKDGYKIASFVLNATTEFGSEIGVLLKNALFTERSVQEIPTGESQMLAELGGFAQIQQYLSEHKAFTITGLAAALALVFQYALGFPPDLTNVEKSVKFFGDRCRGLKSMVDFGKSSWSVFEAIADWILKTLFPGMRNTHDLDAYVADYGRWATEVEDLHSPESPFHEKIKKDKTLIYKVEKLYRKGLQFSIALGKMQIPTEMRDHYQKHWKLILDYQKVADYSGVLGNKPRPKPLMVHLFGESGVGKSGATWPLASDFNAAVSDDARQAADVAAEIYFRNTEQEFWDGYAGQNVCVYDDFGQRTDTSAKPNEEFMEIIRVGNVAAYPLHMAELQEKSRTKFVSKFVILTSNVIEQKVSSLTFPSAFRRRIDVCAKVEVKPEYEKEGFNADASSTVKRLDPEKCDGACDTSPYIFALYNPETKQPISDDEGKTIRMDYEEFLEHCLLIANESFARSYDFNDTLTTRITEDRFKRLKRLMGGISKKKSMPTGVSQFNLHEGDGNEAFCAVDEECRVHDSIVENWLACKQIPLLKRVVREFQEKIKEVFNLKSALLLVGTVLGGLSIWKLFKKIRAKKTPLIEVEGTSGDAKTLKTRTIVSEAQFTNHRSKAVSKALRHQMKSIDGFHDIDAVLHHLRVLKMTREELMEIVRTDKKSRFMVQGDQIRANQGHSYEIDPEKLFTPSTAKFATHFTHVKCLDSIKKEGVLSLGREWVHLYPGLHTVLPANFSGRSAYVHVDLSKCSGTTWATSNGYVHVKEVPVCAITAYGNLITGQSEAASGDAKTGLLKKIQTEGLDAKTIIAPIVVAEAAVSGDPTTRKMARIQVEGIPVGECQMWADRTAQELITYRILNNLYRIEVDGNPRLNGLFVRDTVMLTCQHLKRVLTAHSMMRIWNMRGSEFTVPVKDLKIVVLSNRVGEDKDAMLIQFPRYVNGHSDLVKHFQKMPELSERRTDVCLPMIRTISDTNLFFVMGNTNATMETSQFREDVDGTVFIRTYRDSLRYKANTTSGDCGAPVIVNDKSFIRKIAGIHSSALTDGSGVSIGQSVTQADLERGFALLDKPIIQDADELPNLEIPQGVVQFETLYGTHDLMTMFDIPGETFGHVGNCGKVNRAPGKTDIRPSEIHGYVTPITKPAKLYDPNVNITHLNVKKNALNTPYISPEEVDDAVSEVKTLLLSGESRKRLAKIYSFEEAVSGSQDSEYVGKINRQTSPGYPWVLDRISGMPGKTTWFGTDDWTYPDEIKEVVSARIESAKQGKRLPVIWTDTLKDERRPIEKVNAMKTRVFAHGPMDYTLAVRQYFIGFIAHIMENRIVNEQSVGTNPFGPDWGITARKLSRYGDRVFAGDFSTFDGTLNSCILSQFAKVANEFYNDGPENALVREVLLLDVYNSVHLCEGKYLQLTHSQPSGNPLTTILNSFYNSVSMRIAYKRCFEGKAPPFSENVSMVSYGDDNVVNISPNVSETFNQRTVTAAYASFGMIYTDESKSDGEVAKWRKITEVTYLKRFFRKEDGVWLAPLMLEALLEPCNWIRKCSDPVAALQQTVEGTFRELARHEKTTFDEWSKTICDVFYEKTDVYPLLKTRVAYLMDTESPIV